MAAENPLGNLQSMVEMQALFNENKRLRQLDLGQQYSGYIVPREAVAVPYALAVAFGLSTGDFPSAEGFKGAAYVDELAESMRKSLLRSRVFTYHARSDLDVEFRLLKGRFNPGAYTTPAMFESRRDHMDILITAKGPAAEDFYSVYDRYQEVIDTRIVNAIRQNSSLPYRAGYGAVTEFRVHDLLEGLTNPAKLNVNFQPMVRVGSRHELPVRDIGEAVKAIIMKSEARIPQFGTKDGKLLGAILHQERDLLFSLDVSELVGRNLYAVEKDTLLFQPFVDNDGYNYRPKVHYLIQPATFEWRNDIIVGYQTLDRPETFVQQVYMMNVAERLKKALTGA